MSGYTSGNNAPTLMAQAPNRKGNMSKDPAKKGGGVTAVTRSMGAPAAGGNPGAGRGQKVQVSRPADNCGYNDSYRNSSYLA
jgi:hypothetical protein